MDAYWLTDNIILPYQRGLVRIGLNSAFKVGLAAGVLTTAGLWYFRPDFAFDKETGQVRPWSLLAPDEAEQTGPGATRVPWYVVSASVFYTLNLIA